MSEFTCDIEESRFDQQVLQQQRPVIIDFWAPWCGPCKAMTPIFTALAESYAQKMVFAKCNVDENQSLAMKYGIKSIPTVMIFQNGNIVHRLTGLAPQQTLVDAIEKTLAGEAPSSPFIVN